jgi:hypothetical protein
MLINLRGTNGSGKSTVVRKFFERCQKSRELFGVLGPRRPEAYAVGLKGVTKPLYLIGPYQTPTGGVDALGLPVEGLIKLLEKYKAKGHVLFEGVVISTTFGALGNWMSEDHKNALVIYLDTSLEDCLSALGERGANRGTLHVEQKHKSIAATQKAFDAAMIKTAVVSRAAAFDFIWSQLK